MPTAWCAALSTGHVAVDGSSLVVTVPCSSLLMSLLGRWWRCSNGLARRSGVAGGVLTGGALTPVDDFGLVDAVPGGIGRLQAWRSPDGAVDVHHPAARSADHVVVVVADAVLETSRGPGGLDPSDETVVGQHAEGVVHRLAGDHADLRPHRG